MKLRVVFLTMFLTGLFLIGTVWAVGPRILQPEAAAAAAPAQAGGAEFVSAEAPQAPEATDAYTLIAVPLQDSRLTDADSLAAMVDATQVWNWYPALSAFDIYFVGSGFGNFPLVPGDSYMVVTNGPSVKTNLSMYGAVPDRVFTLYRPASGCKFNLISLPKGGASLTTAQALADDIGGVTQVWDWIPSLGAYNIYFVDSYFDDFPVKFGYPYMLCLSPTGSSTWP